MLRKIGANFNNSLLELDELESILELLLELDEILPILSLLELL